ncbi:MAG: Na+/H+ antiporter [Actinobacteria bacterium]|nr:Na+/H+ antiporter [Actinomycetota bacterium]
MEIAMWLVLGVLAVVAVSALADRIGISAPLLLVVAGLGVSFLPFVPDYDLNPEVVLVGILPPLLYSAAYNTSFIDFKAKKGTIASLSVGLVIFTTLIVGWVTYLVVPDIPLAAGFALGAIVAPPDAVAATAVAKRVGMPTSIVQVLEGESLVNDATALTALRTAIVAIAGTVTVLEVGLGFLLAAGGGVVIGLIFAVIISMVRKAISNPLYDTPFSLASPYLAYLCAEEIEASGVIAVVVAGLLVGHKSPRIQSGSARLISEANWRAIAFVLENIVFLIIGLQLPYVLAGVQDDNIPLWLVVTCCGSVYLATVLTRFVWVYGAALLADIRWFGVPKTTPNWPELTVIGWAGMRGVVTLAAALTLPLDVVNRELLILVAFVLVIASLLIQGTTLKALVHRLRLRPPDEAEQALQQAALLDRMTRAGRNRLAELGALDNPELEVVVKRISDRAEDRRNAAWERASLRSETETPVQVYSRLRLEMLGAERDEVLCARDEGGFDDEVIRRVIRLLDVEEGMLDGPQTVVGGDDDLVTSERLSGTCEHLLTALPRPVPEEPVCGECIEEGLRWVKLRMCLECGHVGCCDSSVGRHATKHFEVTEHPVMRSVEPGEAWRWCYVDELLG